MHCCVRCCRRFELIESGFLNMTTKKIATFLLGIIIISFVRAEIVTTPSGHFLRNEPAEKVIWYGGLVAKMISFYGQACANRERVKPALIWQRSTRLEMPQYKATPRLRTTTSNLVTLVIR